MAKSDKPTIVIRKEEVVEGGHHGGAWKVAYADFVTAMMAFFLLMWLLNATTEEQRRGIADYFSPNNELARVTSGYGAPFGGRTPNSVGDLASDNGTVQAVNAPPMPLLVQEDDDTGDERAQTPLQRSKAGDGEKDGGLAASREEARNAVKAAPPNASAPASARADKDIQAEIERHERASFEQAAQQIREAMSADPALSDLARQLMIDVTPEGLRVQLVDAERQPMFATGSATINERARAVLGKIAPVLMKLPEQVSITGHTDAAPYRGGDRSNWDLSADRANATRRLLVEAGLPESRIRSVAGMAERDPLVREDPAAAANRRIAIVVLRTKPAGAEH